MATRGSRRQVASVRSWCDEQGHEVVDVVAEVGPATGPDPVTRAVTAALDGNAGGIAVWSADRLWRGLQAQQLASHLLVEHELRLLVAASGRVYDPPT